MMCHDNKSGELRGRIYNSLQRPQSAPNGDEILHHFLSRNGADRLDTFASSGSGIKQSKCNSFYCSLKESCEMETSTTKLTSQTLSAYENRTYNSPTFFNTVGIRLDMIFARYRSKNTKRDYGLGIRD